MAKKSVGLVRPGAPAKLREDKTSEKAVLMLTPSQFDRLKELSADIKLSVSAILREALMEKYPRIFKEK